MNGAFLTKSKCGKFRTNSILATVFICLSASQFAHSIDLKTALDITLQTNPDIAESAANRRAIDFEYEQARRLNNPSIFLEGRVGPQWVDTRTTRILGNDEDVLFARQASVTVQQNLMSFGRNNSERDRQASRIDAAAYRVAERSELVALDVVQAYFDILRLREVLEFADLNVAFHENKSAEIMQSVSGGVRSEADAQQSRERLSAARVSMNETEEALKLADSKFVQYVGQEIGKTHLPPDVHSHLPPTLGDALKKARANNPTLKIVKADLDTARAEYRKSKSENRPTLAMEISGRAGDHVGGFKDRTNDVQAQLVFRHEFRGGIKSAATQEHLNRIDEVRQRVMRLERNVDGLVREAWATRNSTAMRKTELAKQVAEGERLLDSYQREFTVGRRTLLDILDSQSSLFQAQTSLSTATYSDLYAQYRILASTGELLSSLGLTPRGEANANLREYESVEPTPPAETEPRRYPDHYSDTDTSLYGNASYTNKPLPTNIALNDKMVKAEKKLVETTVYTDVPPIWARKSSLVVKPIFRATKPAVLSAASAPKAVPQNNVNVPTSNPEITQTSKMRPIQFVQGPIPIKRTPEIAPDLIAKSLEINTDKDHGRQPAIGVKSNSASAGVPVVNVSVDNFNQLRNQTGAITNMKMNTVFLDGVLYITD